MVEKTETKDSKKSVKDKIKIVFNPDMDEYEGESLAIHEEDQKELDSLLEMINLQEVLSVAGRIRKRQSIRRYRSRMNIARKRALKRRATGEKIQNRARRSAVSNLKRKFSGGVATKKMSYSQRARVEKMVARRGAVVTRSTRRLIRVKRATERARLSRRK